MGPLGIIGWIFLFSIAGLAAYKQVFKMSSTLIDEKKQKWWLWLNNGKIYTILIGKIKLLYYHNNQLS